ncbi:hypothetical protein EK21DRAFT_114309 [Setomelanomma holmii]|uniref:C3H1-type domain-containing protein n=1 Tax=Setomelanomma holmii TaxID=210430 RepID=A0A9P4LIG4_9PLEO|nr:hypothetical protein EK21DRAFT_114309 [Setomelanomma holmii]
MARKTRSNTLSSQTFKEITNTKSISDSIPETILAAPVSTETAAPIEEEATMPTNDPSTIITTVVEHEEDLIDYDDDDLDVPIGTADVKNEHRDINLEVVIAAPDTHEDQAVTFPEEATEASNTMYEHAKYAMIWGTTALLTKNPELATALGLNDVENTVTVDVSQNGFTYEVIWKVKGIENSNGAPEEVSIASTEAQKDTAIEKSTTTELIATSTAAATTATYPSKSRSMKLCVYVNTPQGCSGGSRCEFSHEKEGKKCTSSDKRMMCPNGRKCAFKHWDDFKSATWEDGIVGVPHKAPTGPKVHVLGKRGRDHSDDAGAKRVKVSHAENERSARGRPQRGRGCGHGRGRGRGRGGSREPGMRVKGVGKTDAQ